MRAAAREAGYAVVFRALGEPTLRDALDNAVYDLVMPFGSALPSASGRPTVVSENLLQTPFTIVTVSGRELPEMDDFGSGYSSLHMLKEVPVDRIKLDLNFLTGTGDPERGRVIVRYMIQMVRSLGMDLIAEGVENVTQARFLLSRGCSEMQGFYFYKPMSAQEFEGLPERTPPPDPGP